MSDRSLSELNMRRTICQVVIKTIDQMDDPRKAVALKRYRGQLATLDAEIKEITGTPPPVVVGLKTVNLTGKSGLS